MKGSGGEVLMTLVIIVFMFFYIYAFSYIAATGALQTEKIIFEESEVIEAKNTLYALNTSLRVTWLISALQSLYTTDNESVGCGYDDGDTPPGGYNIEPGYWYQTNITVQKNRPIDIILPISGSKYNAPDKNPRICTPDFSLLGNYGVNNYLRRKFLPYQEIPKNFTVGGIKFLISNLDNHFVINELDKITVTNSERVEADLGDTRIDSTLNQTNTIYTEFPKMIRAAQAIVLNALELSNSMVYVYPLEPGEPGYDPDNPWENNPEFKPELKYLSNYHTNPTPNKYAYEKKITSYLEDYAKNYVEKNLNKTSIDIDTSVEMRGITFGDEAFTRGQNVYLGQGILLHYKMDLKMLEGTEGMKPLESPPPLSESLRRAIEAVVKSLSWDFGDPKKYTNDEIIALTASMLQQDGGFYSGLNPSYPSPTAGTEEFRKIILDASTATGVPAPFLAATSYMEASGYWNIPPINDVCVLKYSYQGVGQLMTITRDYSLAFSKCGYSSQNSISTDTDYEGHEMHATGPMQLDVYWHSGYSDGNYIPEKLGNFKSAYGFEFPVHGESYFDTSIYYAAVNLKYIADHHPELSFDTPEGRIGISYIYGTSRGREAEFEEHFARFSENAPNTGDIKNTVTQMKILFDLLKDKTDDKNDLIRFVIAGHKEGIEFFTGNPPSNPSFVGVFALCGEGLTWDEYDRCLRDRGLYIETLNYVKKVMAYYPNYLGGTVFGVKSKKVLDTADLYIGCGYGGTTPVPIPTTRGDCNGRTMQCGAFVGSVFQGLGMSGIVGHANGNIICNAPGIGKKFTDRDQLKPGDIFSTNRDSFGHTGIIVGTGTVSSDNKHFTPGTGDIIVIHSSSYYGGDYDGVKYSTLDEVLRDTKPGNTIPGAALGSNKYVFCRHKVLTKEEVTVAIDAGHGGSDTGAIGPTGVKEKDVNLAIAHLLKASLESSGVNTYMTRTSDVYVSDSDRMKNAKLNNANIFVSIHTNDFLGVPCPDKGGTETVYSDNIYKSDNEKLANLIQKNIVKRIKRADNGVYSSSDTSRNTEADNIIGYDQMPATLVETLFICNPDEEAILNSSKGGQKLIALGIYDGIMEYLNSLSMSPEPNYDEFTDLYYFHDEAENRFRPKPIELKFKIEDYLIALDCNQRQFTGKNASGIDQYTQMPYSFFNWFRESDLMCCAGTLYACNSEDNIPGVDTKSPGFVFDAIKRHPEPGCELAMKTLLKSVPTACYNITCTDNGFVCATPSA